MKKILGIVAAALMAAFTGCKTAPSVETLYSTSYAIGVSAALVTDQTKISDESRNAIIEVMNEVDRAVPQTNTTFTVAWTPIATEHIAKLVEKGKINADEGKLIFSAFSTAVNTLDYFVFKRYPQVGQNIEYVEAVTHGFTSGFLTFFKPANPTCASGTDVVYDKEAYDYMLKLQKRK